MKKILHFIDSGGLYGAESVILNLSREMLVSKDYTPVIGCIVQHQNEKNELFDKAITLGIAAVKIVINNKRFFIDIPRSASLTQAIGIDCIHSHGYKASVVAFVIRLFTGIPITATCHLWYMGGKRPLKQRVMTAVELFFYKFFPVVIAVSDSIRDFLVSIGVSKRKIKVIKNGIFVEDYRSVDSKDKNQVKEELGIDNAMGIILNIARLTQQKAQYNIILAAKKLKQQGYRLKYLIVGDGELREEIEREASCEGVADDVLFLGFRDDIDRLLHSADVFVLPSLDEGMPISLLEAVASATPVVATPVGDIPKLIVHEEGGILVGVGDIDALANAVARLVDNPGEGQRFAANGRQMLEKFFSSRSMFQEYDTVYRQHLQIQ